jgi:hypothetical protein
VADSSEHRSNLATDRTPRDHLAVARVDRALPPKQWDHWAITRANFASLIDRMAEIVQPPSRKQTVEVRFPGFERPFSSGGEFLENVDESAWVEAP